MHDFNWKCYLFWLSKLSLILILYYLFTGKKTIVFDLDETLIHCNESTDIPADIVVPIKFPNNETVDVIIYYIIHPSCLYVNSCFYLTK